MARFTAPAHVTGVDLSSGPAIVVNGIVEVADEDLSQGDLAGLAANGFVPFVEAVKPIAADLVAVPEEAPPATKKTKSCDA